MYMYMYIVYVYMYLLGISHYAISILFKVGKWLSSQRKERERRYMYVEREKGEREEVHVCRKREGRDREGREGESL